MPPSVLTGSTTGFTPVQGSCRRDVIQSRVKALLRIAVVYNIPVACNRATADFIVSSPLMREEYRRLTMGIEDQLVRWVPPVHTM